MRTSESRSHLGAVAAKTCWACGHDPSVLYPTSSFHPQQFQPIICKLWPACDNGQLLLRHQLVEPLCLTHAGATYPPIKTTDPTCSQDGSASHSCIWILVLRALCWNDLWRASAPLRMEFSPQLDSSPRPSSHAHARLNSESDMIMLGDSKIT